MSNTSRYTPAQKERIFQVFKYTIYFLLFLNVFYWLREDYLASAHTFRDGFSWSQIGDVFAQAVDTFAWLILLLALELETYVISDDKLKGRVKWALNLVAGACYILILASLNGYIEKMGMVFSFDSTTYETACAAVGQVYSYALDLDDYAALTAENCHEITQPFYVNTDVSIMADAAMRDHLQYMGLVEVINASAWVLIVLLLWIDVFIQLTGSEHGKLYRINLACKFILYLTLIAACIYWGYAGDFMDFWDAFLWIIAFFFIELNIFKWSEELEQKHSESTV